MLLPTALAVAVICWTAESFIVMMPPQNRRNMASRTVTDAFHLTMRIPSALPVLSDGKNVAVSVMSSSSESSVSTSTSIAAVPLGGDFAGLFATFDLQGRLIPVPEHFVPPVLLEWGQAPPALEVLVSEDAHTAVATADDVDAAIWTRNELTILPETGCGVDNLEVIHRVEEVPVESIQVLMMQQQPLQDKTNDEPPLSSMVAIARTLTQALPNQSNNQHIRVETTFGLEMAEDDKSFRSRLGVDMVWDDDNSRSGSPWRLQPLLRLFLERQTSPTSSRGTVANGGGLDGRTVSRLIGPTIRQYEKQLDHDPTWTVAATQGMPYTRMEPTLSGDAAIVVLPGNITLSYGVSSSASTEWILQVCQGYPDTNERLVVQHMWTTSSRTDAMQPLVEMWHENV